MTPARLTPHEDVLVGLQLKGGGITGSFGAAGGFVAPGATEVDLEQDVVGTLRFAGNGQASLLVPVVETVRSAGTLWEAGGGIGDVALQGRWDFLLAGESVWKPGFAAIAGVSLPTGRAADDASHALGTDATGTGTFGGTLGLTLEQSWRHAFVSGALLVSQTAPRTSHAITTLLGTRLTVGGAAGWLFDDTKALALTATWQGSRDAHIDGHDVSGTGIAKLALGLIGAMALSDDWRLQATFSLVPPAGSFGRNDASTLTFTFLVMRTWT